MIAEKSLLGFFWRDIVLKPKFCLIVLVPFKSYRSRQLGIIHISIVYTKLHTVKLLNIAVKPLIPYEIAYLDFFLLISVDKLA